MTCAGLAAFRSTLLACCVQLPTIPGGSWRKPCGSRRVSGLDAGRLDVGTPPLEFYMESPDEPESPEIAARVYDAAARMVFGPMAILNFPGKGPPDEVSDVQIRRKLVDAGWPEGGSTNPDLLSGFSP